MEKAQHDLDEVPSPRHPLWRLHLTDYHLEQARLLLAQGKPASDARPHYEAAKKLIEDGGYHRDSELADLEKQLKEAKQLRVTRNILPIPASSLLTPDPPPRQVCPHYIQVREILTGLSLSRKIAAAGAVLLGLRMGLVLLLPKPERYLDTSPDPFGHDLTYTFSMLLFTLFAVGVFWAIAWDQYRCRTCLRRLRMPVLTGSWTNVLFGAPRVHLLRTRHSKVAELQNYRPPAAGLAAA